MAQQQATQPRAEPIEEEWLTLSDASLLSGVALGTLYRKIREGQIPAFDRLGKTVFRKSDILEFMVPKLKVPKLKRGPRGKYAGRKQGVKNGSGHG